MRFMSPFLPDHQRFSARQGQTTGSNAQVKTCEVSGNRIQVLQGVFHRNDGRALSSQSSGGRVELGEPGNDGLRPRHRVTNFSLRGIPLPRSRG